MSTQCNVKKFGGSSLADASQIRKVAAIIQSDPYCRFVVVSAPGARSKGDPGVTNLLINLHGGVGGAQDRVFGAISDRFMDIVTELSLNAPFVAIVREHLDWIRETAAKSDSLDYCKSRGEYLSALILAKLLGWRFLDAAEFIRFDASGRFDIGATRACWAKLDLGESHCIIPGYYGAMPDGSIKTFPRGGSDITGAIVAVLTDAACYQNWTDVSGVYTAHPDIVPDAHPIASLAFSELRELAYGGAKVLHHEVIPVLRPAGIPIRLLNTNRPEDVGSLIIPDSAATPAVVGTIAGLAGRTGFTVITFTKEMMNAEVGFLHKLLGVFARRNISVEHVPSGVDVVSVVVDTECLNGNFAQIRAELDEVCRADAVTVSSDMALVCVVGRGMAGSPGIASKVLGAVAGAGVNVLMITQGASEISMTIGVDASDCGAAMRAIHAAFM